MNKKKILVLAMTLSMVAILAIGGTIAYFTDTTDPLTNAFTVGNVDIELDEPEWDEEKKPDLMPGIDFAKDPTITVDENSRDCYAFLKLEMNKYVSLINLMGVDAYKNNVGGLEGTYPNFTTFAVELADNFAVRSAVADRWFKGIEHENWQIMNMDEIKAEMAKAAYGTNPDYIEVILGYIGNGDPVLSAGDEVTFMTAFGMPETVTASMFDGEDAYYGLDGQSKSNFNTDSADFKMIFTAYAIQADDPTATGDNLIDSIDDAYAALFN